MFFLALIFFIFVGEFFLKSQMEGRLSLFPRVSLFHNRIILRKYHNKGAFLNLLEKKTRFLHFISIVFTLFITILFLITLFQKGNTLLKFGLSLLLGGAFSNTYDRLSRGFVVDYFSFNSPFPSLNRIVFNISDFCIIVGCLLLVLSQKQ